jgi:hypothetical protein
VTAVDVADNTEYDWWLLVACRGTVPTSAFYPLEPDYVPLAVRLACDRCVVRSECQEHALRHELHGIWAGMTAERRERLRKVLGIRCDVPDAGMTRGTHAGDRNLPAPAFADDELEDDPWSWMK